MIVVGIALIDDDRRVLAAQRARPPDLAGLWEFPGGKVENAESDHAALIRECDEELGVEVSVGEVLGEVTILGGDATLRVWLGKVIKGTPLPHEHRALRWLAADELDSVAWIPADRPLVDQLRGLLRSSPVT